MLKSELEAICEEITSKAQYVAELDDMIVDTESIEAILDMFREVADDG